MYRNIYAHMHETAVQLQLSMVWANYIYIVLTIRNYGSTFYIWIAMVILAYFGPMGKLKFQFSFSVSTQLDFYQHQSGEHVES